MAESLIARQKDASNIIASDIDPKRLELLKKKFGIKTAKNNLNAFNAAQVVVLAVKPQHLKIVLDEISNFVEPLVLAEKTIVSIVAGVKVSSLEKWLKGAMVIRAMPNNPCLIGQGITALAKGKSVTAESMRTVEDIFRKVGAIEIVPEKWMDAVTGLSGSGPAFVYQTIEALTAGGVKSGLPPKIALRLALHTVLGSAQTALLSGKTPKELCVMVASPGGTTMEGLKVLEQNNFTQILSAAVEAAAKKSKKLSSHGS